MAAIGPTESATQDNTNQQDEILPITRSPVGWFLSSPRSGETKFHEGKMAGLQQQQPAVQEEASEPKKKKKKKR